MQNINDLNGNCEAAGITKVDPKSYYLQFRTVTTSRPLDEDQAVHIPTSPNKFKNMIVQSFSGRDAVTDCSEYKSSLLASNFQLEEP